MRRLCWIFLVCLLMGCAVPGGAPQIHETTQSVTIVYATNWEINDSLDKLMEPVAVSHTGPEPDTVTFCVQQLLKEPASEPLISPFPRGTKLLSSELKNSVLTLNFSAEYTDLTGHALTLAIACTTLTLCSLPNVDSIVFCAEGKPYPKPSDPKQPEHQFRISEFVSDGLVLKPVEKELELFFIDESTLTLASVTRNVVIRENEPAERYVMEELFNGPKDASLKPIVQGEITVLNVYTKNSICYVSFPDAFYASEPSATYELTIQAIVQSLTALEGREIKSVQFLRDDDIAVAYGDQPLDKPVFPHTISTIP